MCSEKHAASDNLNKLLLKVNYKVFCNSNERHPKIEVVARKYNRHDARKITTRGDCMKQWETSESAPDIISTRNKLELIRGS